MYKTKAKTKLIILLNALLGVVFAFMVGYTLCDDSNPIKTARTQQGSTAAYLANNSFHVVNATIENPIMFGPGAHNTKVAVEYNLNYNFDVRIKYSLEWSDTNLSTDNVILHYANRDRFIVDDEYIYLTDLIEVEKTETTDTRHGILNIFTGVEFINPEDEDYFGETLTIEVEVEIAKEETISYNASSTPKSTHPLYVNCTAGNAWAKYRSNGITSGKADIIVYNTRYYDGTNVHNGIEYPDAVTAYKYSTASSKDTTKLFGNRYYAGVGLYVMTGNSDVVITVKSMGDWQKIAEYVLNTNSAWATNTYYSKSGNSYTLLTSQPADWNTNYGSYYVKNIAAAFTNNIYYNFDSKWATATHDANHTISSIKIAANKAVYINVYDSIEITSIMETEAEIINYSGYRLVSSFYLNNSLMSGSKIDYLENVSSSGSATTTYAGSNYSITNSSVYNPIWVDNSNNPSFAKQATNVAITNNTAAAAKYTITYKPKYTTSNGSQVLRTAGGFDSSLTSTNWARADFYGAETSINVVVAPYSTVSILNEIEANTSVTGSNLLINSDYYDAWLSYEIVSVQTSADTTTTDSISVEVKNNGGTKNVYLRNNSNETVTIPSGSTVQLRGWSYDYGSITSKPPTWDVDYWRYFIKISDNEYVRATKTSQWASNTYYLFSKSSATSSISTSSAITLVPNSSVYVGEWLFSGDVVSYEGSLITSQATNKTSIVAEGGVGIVNNDSNSAYVVNDTANSYYIRFKSTYDNDVNEKTFIVSGNYCYYIGVLRPNQVLEIPNNGTRIDGASANVEVILADETFDVTNCSDIGDWAKITDVANAFKVYFS